MQLTVFLLFSTVWGYGFLFVTIINLCSLVGVFVLPLMKKSFYSDLLMFLVALAVGCLSTNGILELIPEVRFLYCSTFMEVACHCHDQEYRGEESEECHKSSVFLKIKN